jgi:hypothetical protein
MTQAVDNFLVNLEFDRDDLVAINNRGIIYVGIVSMLLLSMIFFSLTVADVLILNHA